MANFEIPASVVVSGAGSNTGKKVTLDTAGKYVDRNIEITPTATVADGAIKANAPTVTGGSASMAAKGFTAAGSATTYYVELTTTGGTAKSNAGVQTAGWVETTDTAASASATSVAVSGNGSKVYIPDAAFTKGTTTVSSNVATMGTYSNTAGYATANEGALSAATFSNTATSGTTYVDVSDAKIGSSSGSAVMPVLKEGDYLYINQGYVDNLKVSLARLVPDSPSSGAFATSNQMLKGYSLFDKDGKTVTGSIEAKTADDVSVAGDTIVVVPGFYGSVVTKTVAAGSRGGLTSEASATGNITLGVATETQPTEGYYIKAHSTSSEAEGTTGWTTHDARNGSTDDTYYPVQAGACGALTATAGAEKGNITIGTAATTAPSSGYYFKVTADASEAEGTTGWTVHNGQTATQNVKYYPVTSGSRGAITTTAGSGANTNITVGTATTTKPTSGYYFQATAAASEAAGTTGWTALSKRDATTTSKYYPINAAALTHGNTATATNPTVTVSGSRTGVNSATSGDYYVTVTGSQTAAGSVKHTASVSEGYVPTAGLSKEATIATAATVSGSGTKIYLASGNAVGNPSLAKSTKANTDGYETPLFVGEDTTKPQVVVKANVAATTGNVVSGKTENSNYLNYYTGSYTVAE